MGVAVEIVLVGGQTIMELVKSVNTCVSLFVCDYRLMMT